MSLVKLNGTSDYLKWATLAAAIQNTPTGPWTFLFGIRHNTVPGAYQAYGYLLSGTGAGTVQQGLSKKTNNDPVHDVGNSAAYSTQDPTVSTDILYVCSKATGSSVPNLSKKVASGGTWAHQAGSASMVDASAAAQLQLGVWELNDFFNGWFAVFALWNVELTQAQRIACGANWRTSDIWNAHTTKPLVLVEFNVAAASLANIGSESLSGAAHSGTTLDSGQGFGGWTFDGVGGVAAPDDKFFAFI